MSNKINIYCDESCHLENDNSTVMMLGAICCPENKRINIYKELRQLKKNYNLSEKFEVKWTKVSNSKIEFYIALVDYFIKNSSLTFRGLIVPNKNKIDNLRFSQTWDTFYYKMYYQMLKNIINSQHCYNIFLDIKDSNGAIKRKRLLDILNNIMKDFSYSKGSIVNKLQAVRSNEVELVQLADFIIGAICYANRGLNTNKGKLKVIEHLRSITGYPLTESTFPSESKFNLFKIKLRGDDNA